MWVWLAIPSVASETKKGTLSFRENSRQEGDTERRHRRKEDRGTKRRQERRGPDKRRQKSGQSANPHKPQRHLYGRSASEPVGHTQRERQRDTDVEQHRGKICGLALARMLISCWLALARMFISRWLALARTWCLALVVCGWLAPLRA